MRKEGFGCFKGDSGLGFASFHLAALACEGMRSQLRRVKSFEVGENSVRHNLTLLSRVRGCKPAEAQRPSARAFHRASATRLHGSGALRGSESNDPGNEPLHDHPVAE